VLDSVNRRYHLICSCAHVEGVCILCRHILKVMHVLCDNIDLTSLDWHPRVLLAQYYQCLVGQREFTDATIARNNYHPHLRQIVVEEAFEQDYAVTDVGVPQEGLLDANFNVTEFPEYDADDNSQGHGDGNTGRSRTSSRQPLFNQAYSAAKQLAISDALGKTNALWKEYCLLQNAFLLKVNRMHVAKGGTGKRNRIRAAYEGECGPAPKAPKVSKPDWMHSGLTMKKARRVLEKGAKEGWVVEVFPNDKDPRYSQGDRWFAEVIDGLVTGKDRNLSITSCRWFEKNSVTIHENVGTQPIEIDMVKAYGPRTAPMFSDLK
jgi:hypothetical protein